MHSVSACIFSTKKLHKNHRDGYYQEQVDKSSKRIRHRQTEEPQDHEQKSHCEKHMSDIFNDVSESH